MRILDLLPVWVVYLLVVGMILLSAEIGFRLGVEIRRRDLLTDRDSATSAMIGAVLGLLAFFLAFSIGFALNNFNTRRQLSVSEANAIGTAYLRAGYLDEVSRTEVQDLFREYVDLRLLGLDPAKLEDAIIRSEEIHNQLWTVTETYAVQNPESVVGGLFVESVNEVIDLHATRVTANQSLRIPEVVYWMITGIIIFAFLLVGLGSSADGRRNYFSLAIFALAFASAIYLLVDLDSPYRGLIDVSQNAMISLQTQIGIPGP